MESVSYALVEKGQLIFRYQNIAILLVATDVLSPKLKPEHE